MIGVFGLKYTITPALKRKLRALLNWFIIPSLLLLMIHTVFVLPSRPGVWRFIGEHLEQIYHGSEVLTAVNCFVYAIVILILRLRAADSEGWADFIGLAFVVLVIHYLFLFWVSASGDMLAPDWKVSVFAILLSAFSNVFLVAAGLVLLDRYPFPMWNIVTQVVFASLGIVLSLGKSRYQRFPDAIASAFCIYWVGYALYINIRYSNSGFSDLARKLAGQTVLTSVLLYILCGLFYASVPFMTNWNWNSQVIAKIEVAAQGKLKLVSRQRIADDKGQKEEIPQTQAASAQDKMKIRELMLDSVVILIFFALKFVIFLATLFLLLGSIIFVSSKHANEIFDPIVQGIGEYLTDEGITRLIAERLDTASTVLYVKIPGKRKTLYAKFSWPLQLVLQSDRRVRESGIDVLALAAIRSGTEQKYCPSYDKGPMSDYFPFALARRLPTRVAVPIIFHGAVIGCLLVISKPDRNFSPREIQHFRDLTKLSALSAQAFRENAALDQLSFKFSRILNPKPVEAFDDAIDRVAELLQDVLDPLATGVWLDVGIQRHISLRGQEEYQLKLRSRVENGESFLSGAPDPDDVSFEMLSFDIEVKPSDGSRDKRYTIGKLAILVPSQNDMLDRPILGRNNVFLRAVTARTTSSVLEITMEFLNSVIQEFGVRINNLQSTNMKEWFADVEDAAARAGVLWITAEIPDGNPFFGKPEAMLDAQRLQSRRGREGGRYLRIAPLNLSKGKLLIGVNGSSYHNMRNVCPLWRSFFIQFAEMVDSAFQRMISNQEKILHLEREAARLDQEAARSYEFATIAVTTAEIVHQIVNTTRDISLPLKALYETYLVGKLKCADERVEKLLTDLPQSASYLLDLTADFKKLSDPKENVNCNLKQAVELAERLYALQLKKRGVVLEIDVSDPFTIGVPSHVAEQALATLVGNSRDATPNGGHIRISACEEGDMIRCDVTDNGHGVPAQIQSRLFRERNVTTKPNGNGWGLYLVSRSLKDRHGSIELTDSTQGKTTFTLRFPKYNGG